MSAELRARRRALRVGAAALAALALQRAMAQDYPSRPVRIIVPFAPGGSADVFGRALAQRLQEALGQTFVVENRPGGGALVGTDAVAKSAPDGYTLLLMSNTHTVNESLIPNRPYQLMRDFVPVAPINYSDLVLVAQPGLRRITHRRADRAAKAKPGGLNYASSGPGTPYHMAGELFKAMAGVDIVHVPYKGSAGARTDVLGGQVEMMFDAIPTMTEHVKAGKVKALATTGKHALDDPARRADGRRGRRARLRSDDLARPDGAAGTPPAVVNRLNAEIAKIIARAEMRKRLGGAGRDRR